MVSRSAIAPLDEGAKDILGDLFRPAWVIDAPPDKRVNRILVAVKELAEGESLAALEGLQ
jgi:hypothetical protein